MLLLVTYDVNTSTSAGRKRLRQVAKACVAHGQRVQNSVFECNLDEAQSIYFWDELTKLIDKKQDSLRMYKLGNHYKNKVQHAGVKPGYDAMEVMVL